MCSVKRIAEYTSGGSYTSSNKFGSLMRKGDENGVATKKRRRLKYKEQEFVWWVAPNEDDCDKIYLNIVSLDKSIVLTYHLGDGSFAIISSGKRFQGQEMKGGSRLYRIPMKDPLMIVTPKDVEEIIAWAVDGNNAIAL